MRCQVEKAFQMPINGTGGLVYSHNTKELISFSVTNCKWRHPDMQREAQE